MYYTWLSSLPNKTEEALNVLKQGLEACSTSYLLTFTYAECLEKKKQLNEAHEVYQKFLLALTPNLEKLQKAVDKEREEREAATATVANKSRDTSFGANTTANSSMTSANSSSSGGFALPAASAGAGAGVANGDDVIPGFMTNTGGHGGAGYVPGLSGGAYGGGGVHGTNGVDHGGDKSFETQGSGGGSQGSSSFSSLSTSSAYSTAGRWRGAYWIGMWFF
jgi:hypothetical protein